MSRSGFWASISQIIPLMLSTAKTQENERRAMRTNRALAASRCVGERDITGLTEVRRLYRACKSVLGKFGFPPVLSVGRECTASHVFQRTNRQSRSPPGRAGYLSRAFRD